MVANLSLSKPTNWPDENEDDANDYYGFICAIKTIDRRPEIFSWSVLLLLLVLGLRASFNRLLLGFGVHFME